MTLDKQTTEALARIKRNEPAVMDWLSARYMEYCKRIVDVQDEVQLRWIQGQMREISQIVDLVEKAAKLP
jgi:hypothetical protein